MHSPYHYAPWLRLPPPCFAARSNLYRLMHWYLVIQWLSAHGTPITYHQIHVKLRGWRFVSTQYRLETEKQHIGPRKTEATMDLIRPHHICTLLHSLSSLEALHSRSRPHTPFINVPSQLGEALNSTKNKSGHEPNTFSRSSSIGYGKTYRFVYVQCTCICCTLWNYCH